jgi:hypothetical protein
MDEFVLGEFVGRIALSARYAKSAQWALFAYLAEREGFEPSIRLLTLYSLSRGAPSASRASLRVLSRVAAEPGRIPAEAL